MELKDVIKALKEAHRTGRPEFGQTVVIEAGKVEEMLTCLRSVQRGTVSKAEAEAKIAEAEGKAAEAEKQMAKDAKSRLRDSRKAIYGADPE